MLCIKVKVLPPIDTRTHLQYFKFEIPKIMVVVSITSYSLAMHFSFLVHLARDIHNLHSEFIPLLPIQEWTLAPQSYISNMKWALFQYTKSQKYLLQHSSIHANYNLIRSQVHWSKSDQYHMMIWVTCYKCLDKIITYTIIPLWGYPIKGSHSCNARYTFISITLKDINIL